jgi:hypothetical protein
MIMVSSAPVDLGREGSSGRGRHRRQGYDLGYVWKNQAHKDGAEQTVGGYY